MKKLFLVLTIFTLFGCPQETRSFKDCQAFCRPAKVVYYTLNEHCACGEVLTNQATPQNDDDDKD